MNHLHWGGGRWRLHRREVGGGGGQWGGEPGVLGRGSGGRGSGPRILVLLLPPGVVPVAGVDPVDDLIEQTLAGPGQGQRLLLLLLGHKLLLLLLLLRDKLLLLLLLLLRRDELPRGNPGGEDSLVAVTIELVGDLAGWLRAAGWDGSGELRWLGLGLGADWKVAEPSLVLSPGPGEAASTRLLSPGHSQEQEACHHHMCHGCSI